MLYKVLEDYYTKTNSDNRRIEDNTGLKMMEITGCVEGNRVPYHKVYLSKKSQDK
jgi:hypothetical protein